MNMTPDFLITLLSSGAIAAIISGVVSAVMQKRNERESRLFNAKLDAYTEFAGHLESRFVSLTRKGATLDITMLAEVSAKCLLVSSPKLNDELKHFLGRAVDVFEKSAAAQDKKSDFDELWDHAEKVEDLMRSDLGFK